MRSTSACPCGGDSLKDFGQAKKVRCESVRERSVHRRLSAIGHADHGRMGRIHSMVIQYR